MERLTIHCKRASSRLSRADFVSNANHKNVYPPPRPFLPPTLTIANACFGAYLATGNPAKVGRRDLARIQVPMTNLELGPDALSFPPNTHTHVKKHGCSLGERCLCSERRNGRASHRGARQRTLLFRRSVTPDGQGCGVPGKQKVWPVGRN